MNINQLFQLKLDTVFNLINRGQLPVTEDNPVAPRQNTDTFVSAKSDENEDRINRLIAQLGDTDSYRRGDAATELGNIAQGNTNAINALIRLLRSGYPPDRVNAARALGRIGQGSDDAFNALVQATANPTTGSDAAEALVRIGQTGQGTPEAITALTGILGSSHFNDDIKRNAAIALGLIGQNSQEAVRSLTQALQNRNQGIRLSGVEALRRLWENSSDQNVKTQIVTALIPALNDNDPNVVRAAITALGDVGANSREVVRALVLHVFHFRTRPDVQISAREALDKILENSENSIELLTPLLRDDNEFVRLGAAATLGRAGQNSPEVVKAQIVTALIPLLRDSNVNVRRAAAFSLGIVGQDSSEALKRQIVTSLIPLLSDPANEAAAAALGLVGLDLPEAVRALNLLLNDESLITRISAAGALGRISRDPSVRNNAVRTLIPLLNHRDSFYRLRAASALSGINVEELPQTTRNQTVEALIPLLADQSDESQIIRAFALSALNNFSQGIPENLKNRLVTALIPLLRDSNEVIRGEAARVLGGIGRGSAQIARALIPLLNDRSPFVRPQAVNALGSIEQGLPQNVRDEAVTALLPLLTDVNIPASFAPRALANLLRGASLPVRQQAVTPLMGALGNPDRGAQDAASDALVSIGQPAAAQLVPQFGNMSSLTILSVLRGIGEGAIDDLIRGLNHENPVVRANSAQTLTSIIGRNGVRVSEQKLNEIITGISNIISMPRIDRDTQIAAIQALGRLGRQASSAVPLLTSIANNDRLHESVIAAANEALDQIKSK